MRPCNSILSPRGVHKHFPRWRSYTEYGTGSVGDWGAHHLDIARWGLGHDATGPVEVIRPKNVKSDNGAILKFKDGTEILHGGGKGVTFHGETGMIVVNRGRFELWRGEEREFVSKNQLDQVEAKYLKAGVKELHRSTNHTADFLTSVRSRKQPVAGVDIGAGTAICCHLLNIIYRTRENIRWDPAKNTFASGGNPAHLDKPRPPRQTPPRPVQQARVGTGDTAIGDAPFGVRRPSGERTPTALWMRPDDRRYRTPADRPDEDVALHQYRSCPPSGLAPLEAMVNWLEDQPTAPESVRSADARSTDSVST